MSDHQPLFTREQLLAEMARQELEHMRQAATTRRRLRAASSTNTDHTEGA